MGLRQGGPPSGQLSDVEIAKGTVVNRWVRRALAAGLVASLVVAAVVVLRVPLDTTIAYRGNGRDVGLPVLALLLVPLIFVIGLFKSGGPDAGKIPEAERQFIVVGYPIFMLLALGGQLWFAALFFDAAAA